MSHTARASTMVDRKSTRLNSSHLVISYAVFCLNKIIAEPVHVELEFLVQHALEPPGGHIPVRLAVDGGADGHVVRGYLFFNDTATTEIYTLSLHDALPI